MRMDDSNYEKNLEKKLIKNFKSMFHSKLGYEPIVISRNHKEINPEKNALKDIKAVSLDTLEEWFESLVPVREKTRVKIYTKRRYHDVVQIRMIFSYVARCMGYSLPNIGKSLKKDHSTIIHGLKTFRDLMETNVAFREKYEQVLVYLKQKSKEYDAKLLECGDQA